MRALKGRDVTDRYVVGCYVAGESVYRLRRRLGWSHQRIHRALARADVRRRSFFEAAELAAERRRGRPRPQPHIPADWRPPS